MSDVKEAAERLRARLAISTYVMDKHSEAYDKHVDDLRVLANAYLSEHAADDDEAITEEWISGEFDVESRDKVFTHYELCLDSIGKHATISFANNSWDYEVLVNGFKVPTKTRGQLRRLIAALGAS